MAVLVDVAAASRARAGGRCAYWCILIAVAAGGDEGRALPPGFLRFSSCRFFDADAERPGAAAQEPPPGQRAWGIVAPTCTEVCTEVCVRLHRLHRYTSVPSH